MARSFGHFGKLLRSQIRQHDSGDVNVVIRSRPQIVGDDRCALRCEQLAQG
jgi:hypothetical protein